MTVTYTSSLHAVKSDSTVPRRRLSVNGDTVKCQSADTYFTSKNKALLQPVVYRVFQLTGLYPRSTICQSFQGRSSYPISPVLLFLSAGIVVVCLIGIVTFFVQSWETRRQQMQELEFFTLVEFIFTLCDLVQGPLLLVAMVVNSHKLLPLIKHVEIFSNKVVPGKELRLVRFLTVLCMTWHMACVVTVIAAECIYTTTYQMGDSGSEVKKTWTTYIYYPCQEFGFHVPVFAVTIWTSLCIALGTNSQLSQYLLVIMVFIISRACLHIKRSIEMLPGHPVAEYQLAVLRQSRRHFRTIKSLINDVNDVFSATVLICCIRDLMICLSLIATLLTRVERDEGESQEEFAARSIDQKASLVFAYSQSGIGAGNAFIRLSILLYCYGQEAAIKKRLQCLHATVTDDIVDGECARFLSELGGCDTAVSGLGFFYVTKEYLAAMLGLLFTYMILIYQTRDSKGDMDQLMKSREFKSRMTKLSAELSRVVAEVLKNRTI